MYETLKKFLNEGGKCLIIEDSKPIGVILTIDEYEKLKIEIQNKSEKVETKEASKSDPDTKFDTKENSIGDAMAREMDPVRNSPPQWPSGRASAGEISNGVDFPDLPAEAPFYGAKEGASANIDEINLADAESITLEDLGLDELP